MYSNVSDFANYKQYSQQEFLVLDDFDFSELASFEIICYNEEYATLLKSQLGSNPICNKISANGWDVFHRGNRKLVINETETEISIKSEYRDSAYLSIKGEGLKNIEILNPEGIHKETANEIIAYPEIRFTKTEQSFEVHFVDNAIGTRDWLVYSNFSYLSQTKQISNTKYEISKDFLMGFKRLESNLKIKLSYELFYPHMINSYHGIAHTTRVCFGAYLIIYHISDVPEYIKEAIYYAAIIHDLGKTTDKEGSIHGENSAKIFRDNIGKYIKDVKIQNRVLDAVKFHSIVDWNCPSVVREDIIFKVLKDSDAALDRGRFYRKCDVSYLRLDIFKTQLGRKIVEFMDKLPTLSRNIKWENPYDDLIDCINQTYI